MCAKTKVSYPIQLIIYFIYPTCPWFAAPSPYSVTQILSEFLYFRANAIPAPTGTCHVTTTRRKKAVSIWFLPEPVRSAYPSQGYTTRSLPGLLQSHFHHNSSPRTCAWSHPFPEHSQCSCLCGQREEITSYMNTRTKTKSLHTDQDVTSHIPRLSLWGGGGERVSLVARSCGGEGNFTFPLLHDLGTTRAYKNRRLE